MALVLKALMEIVIHPQSGRLLGLHGQRIHQFIIYYLHILFSVFCFHLRRKTMRWSQARLTAVLRLRKVAYSEAG